jgi:hypothetical protein
MENAPLFWRNKCDFRLSLMTVFCVGTLDVYELQAPTQ